MTNEIAFTRLLGRLGAARPPLPGATPSAIRRVEDHFGRRMPDDYRAFLAWSDGWEGNYGEAYLQLLSADDVLTTNEALGDLFPGLVAVGGDGGLETYALDFRYGDAAAGLVALDANVGSASIWFIAPSFAEAIERLATQPSGPWERSR